VAQQIGDKAIVTLDPNTIDLHPVVWVPWAIAPRWLFVHAMHFAHQGIEL
jgi:hypothetical protein